MELFVVRDVDALRNFRLIRNQLDAGDVKLFGFRNRLGRNRKGGQHKDRPACAFRDVTPPFKLHSGFPESAVGEDRAPAAFERKPDDIALPVE